MVNKAKGTFGKLSSKFSKDPILYCLIFATIVLAVFFRTYNYLDRIHIHADNAWLIQVSRYAFDNFKIPMVGPFSSAGPFFYGPWYFWIFGLMTILPLGILTHWYVMTILSLLSIYLAFWIGREIGGKWVGAMAALFAAISTAQVNNSFDVWSPALVPFLVTLSLVFLLRFAKSSKLLDLFALSFTVGLAITIHFQSFLLFPTLLVAVFLIFPQKKSWVQLLKSLAVIAIGFVIPFLPLIYFDVNHNWYDTTSLLVFVLVDQYKIWVPNRWFTYLFNYWPETWAYIIGGSSILSLLLIVWLAILTLFKVKSFKKLRPFHIVAIVFFLEVFMLRYYRGERFIYYGLFAHTPVIVLTAYAVWQLVKLNKYLGILLSVLIIFLTVKTTAAYFNNNLITFGLISSIKNDIYQKYPNSNFDMYGCSMNGTNAGHPLALLMYYDRRNSLDGVKIGVCEKPDKSVGWQELTPNLYEGPKAAYRNLTTEHVYKDTVEWYLENPPRGEGNLWKFLKENWRLHH